MILAKIILVILRSVFRLRKNILLSFTLSLIKLFGVTKVRVKRAQVGCINMIPGDKSISSHSIEEILEALGEAGIVVKVLDSQMLL